MFIVIEANDHTYQPKDRNSSSLVRGQGLGVNIRATLFSPLDEESGMCLTDCVAEASVVVIVAWSILCVEICTNDLHLHFVD